jgi:lipopolysaccharide assembly outer membrane protein LptD (OstA)
MIFIFLLAFTPFVADKVEIIRENGESTVHLLGNVIIEDEQTKITCTEARLNDTKGVVVLYSDVMIVDENGEIHANAATYYFREKKGYLSGDVVLLTKDETIRADSLHYDGVRGFVEMYSNVQIDEPKNNLVAYGQKGWYDLHKEQGYLVEAPHMEIFRENQPPLTISAREFDLIVPDNTLYGFDSVIAIIDSITIYSDTFEYNLKTEHGNLVRPTIVDRENELTGESGQFQLKNKNIESFSVEQGWSQYSTDEGSKNIVSGSKISIIFTEGKATKIFVEGKPQGNLYLKQEETDEDAENY